MTSYDLHAESQALAPQLVADRRHLHRHPELAGHEKQTSNYIAGRLEALGLNPKLLLDGTAVTVDIAGEGSGERVLLIRADTDALPIQERGEARPYRSQIPGAMHACGHDGHIAIALATAQLLASHRGQFGGLVRVIFQPAEETAGGAERMIAAGVMDFPPVGAALGLHLWSGQQVGRVGVRDGAIFASADEFGVEIRGRGGHGALPHQALDPIPIASLIVLALQTLVSRETSPYSSTVVTVGTIQAGQAFNIIPETAQLAGTVRAFTEEDRERLLRRIGEVASGIAGAFGASATMTRGAGCPPVVCDPVMAEVVREAVRESSGFELVEPEPLTVGDDVGLFLRRVPGCYFLLGAGNESTGITAPHHHPDFDIDEACLPIGAEVMTRATLDYLAGGTAA
ncbi:MAG TPA: M20 family metallopeptidase [Candidatus Micrarchaeaceae archaeon]|nr:M20 family metallopeptidase [Candidatus Micrarchaeaceae archaeon]